MAIASENPTGISGQGGQGGLKALVLGVKRRIHRKDDKDAQRADVQFRAQRPGALSRAKYQCIFCGFRSKSLNEVHHLDDNHHNNADENLACVCKWCHPYHHVGEAARSGKTDGLEAGHLPPKALGLMRVPTEAQISGQDLNHLMRAIGIGLADEQEAATAQKIFELLFSANLFKQTARSFFPKDETITRLDASNLAAGFAQLTNDEYALREKILADVRIVYHPTLLKRWGVQLKGDQNAFSDPSQWSSLMEHHLRAMGLIEPEGSNAAGRGAEDEIDLSEVMD